MNLSSFSPCGHGFDERKTLKSQLVLDRQKDENILAFPVLYGVNFAIPAAKGLGVMGRRDTTNE